MVNFIKRLFGESEDPEWIGQVAKIKRQFDDINLGVQNAVMRGSVEAQLGALGKASVELPGLLRKLEALLSLKSKRRQEPLAYFREGLTDYLVACQYYKKGLEDNNQMAIVNAAEHMKEAVKMMKKAQKITFGK